MNIKDPRHDLPIWNAGCAASMCTVFAALLVEACNRQLGATPGPHLVCALIFLVQAAALQRSMRAYRADAAHMPGARVRGRQARRAGIIAALLLCAFGCAGMALLRTGWAAGAAMFVALLCVFPWSRIRMCRSRLPLACALALFGGAALLVAAKPAGSPFALLIPAWMFWTAAIGMWLRMILLKGRKARALASYPASG